MAKDEKIEEITEPVLETPIRATAQVTPEMESLLADNESIALVAAKLAVVESMLNLAVRDLKFHEFIREVLLSIMRTVKCEAGSLFEVNQDNETLFFRAAVGQSSDRLVKFVIPKGQGVVGHVAESRMPLVVSNAEQHEFHMKSVPNAIGFDVRNLVAIPILIRGKVFGVLELLNRVGEDNFTTVDVELLTYLCEMAAKAIEVRLMLNWVKHAAERKAKGDAA